MSFLSRRPSRPGSRDDDAGRDDEYGDYDYTPDGYGREEDESWSPGEYFSPGGIKGRWAGGQRSGDYTDARGRGGDAARGNAGRGDARGDSGQGYEDRTDDGYTGSAAGSGYGADEYATGAYELPEGSEGEPAERGSRRRKDRGDWTGIFSLRRDRGEDIWPDDGISDEDYWASVASDQPLTGANPPAEPDPLAAADSRPMGRPGGQAGNDAGRSPASGDDDRAGTGPRPGPAARTGGDQRFTDEPRGVTGRLGPPPGLRGDYQPGGASLSGRQGTGPQAARPGTGPMARPGTGPMAARPGAGSASAWSSQAGFGQPGAGQRSYRPSGPQASYQPASGPQASYRPTSGPQASYQPSGLAGSRPTDSRETDNRQADRGADWGERTERIDRVNASGYPEPRSSSRGQGPSSQGPGRAAPSRTSGPLGAPVAVGRGGADGARGGAESARGSAEGARGEGGWGGAGGADRWATEHRSPDHRTTDHRAPGRAVDRDNVRNSGGWPSTARGGAPADRAGDDDPLTSRAYSRAAVSDADGRSYRVAARRSQAQAKLTEEQTATFTAAAGYAADSYRAGQYESGATGAYPTAQYQTGATGEYPAAQRRAGAPRTGQHQTGEYGQQQADAQASAARYPGYGGQSAQPSSPANLGPSSPPSRRSQSAPAGPSGHASATAGAAGPGRAAGLSDPHSPAGYGRAGGSGATNGAGATGRPSGPQSVGNSGRVTLPGGSATQSGQYPTQSAQPSRQPQQRPHSQPSRHAAPSQLPSGASAGPGGSAGQGGSAGPGGNGSTAGSGPARTAAAATGQNPYDSAVTGSYPYPSQPYPSHLGTPAAPTAANARPAAANPAVDGRDGRDSRDARGGRRHRPGQPSDDGYGSANVDYGTPGYGTSRDGRR
jgi:hypothetical protein